MSQKLHDRKTVSSGELIEVQLSTVESLHKLYAKNTEEAMKSSVKVALNHNATIEHNGLTFFIEERRKEREAAVSTTNGIK